MHFKIGYRPEIDGLRAVAVLSVIIYHAGVNVFDTPIFVGGFVGVDVFFVISGYLITAILLKELCSNGGISYIGFYERRLRRILPALLCVMFCSFLLGWKYLLPPDFEEFSRSILWALGFSSNFYFHYSGLEYGARDSQFLPLLHTWSLSVEEQFYLFVPVALLIAYRLQRTRIISILVIALIMSLLVAQWGSLRYSSANFYMLPSRMWELLAGAILAAMEIKRGYRRGRLNQLFPLIGLALIVVSIFIFSEKTPHPSFYTVLPVAGVCLVIWFAQPTEPVTKFLSSKPMVGLGLISYSLYIWHYPIFVFGRLRNPLASDLEKIVWIFLAALLASATYFLFEKVFRDRRLISGKKFVFIISIATAMVIGTNLFVIKNEGIKSRVPEVLIRGNIDDRFLPGNDEAYRKCHKLFNAKKDEFCIYNSSYDANAYLVGDSHMGAISFSLAEKLKAHSMGLVSMTAPGSYLMLAAPAGDVYERKRVRMLLEVRNSIVIIGGYFHRSVPRAGEFEKFKEEFSDLVQSLIKNENHIILVYPIPDFKYSVLDQMFRGRAKGAGGEVSFDIIAGSLSEFDERAALVSGFFDSLGSKNIYRIYPRRIFCSEHRNECYGNSSTLPYYSDSDHLSSKGADMLTEDILAAVKEITLNVE
jgi:peptidoglycan/LPS O-acetylase OafA/YrhL